MAEANFFNDPEAAHSVVTADWHSLSLVGLNVTTQVRMTDEYIESLATNAVGEFIRDITKVLSFSSLRARLFWLTVGDTVLQGCLQQVRRRLPHACPRPLCNYVRAEA